MIGVGAAIGYTAAATTSSTTKVCGKTSGGGFPPGDNFKECNENQSEICIAQQPPLTPNTSSRMHIIDRWRDSILNTGLTGKHVSSIRS